MYFHISDLTRKMDEDWNVGTTVLFFFRGSPCWNMVQPADPAGALCSSTAAGGCGFALRRVGLGDRRPTVPQKWFWNDIYIYIYIIYTLGLTLTIAPPSHRTVYL